MNTEIKKRFFSNWKNDVPAGLVVFLVALPLCLGVALASTGRPDLLFSGIIAGVIGGVVVGMLSNSPLGVSGPAAGLVVIILTAIETLGSFEAFLLAVVFAGVLQLVAGFAKAGLIGYYFPSSIIKGMLTAIGIILIMKELPHALGFNETLVTNESTNNAFMKIYNAFKYSNLGAVVISLVSLFLLILFDRPFMKKIGLFKFLPGALFVVIIGIFLNIIFTSFAPNLASTGSLLVQLPVAKNLGEFFSFFKYPDFTAFSNPQVYVVAITIAIVASLETLLSVEATDKLDPYKRRTSTNQELKAQGIGNIISGLIGGLPITQVIVRSTANIESGGKTKLGAITHGVILLLAAALIPTFLNLIPLSSLAAILLMVGYKLAKPKLFIQIYKTDKLQFLAFFITMVAVVSTDLLKGIGVGFLVAIFYNLRRNYLNAANLIKTSENGKEVYYLTLAEETTFLNKASISKTLNEIPENSTLIIGGEKSYFVAFDVRETIYEFASFTSKLKNIEVIVKGVEKVEAISSH